MHLPHHMLLWLAFRDESCVEEENVDERVSRPAHPVQPHRKYIWQIGNPLRCKLCNFKQSYRLPSRLGLSVLYTSP